MYNGGLFEPSSPYYDSCQTADPRRRLKQSPTTLVSGPIKHSAVFQPPGEDHREMPPQSASSGLVSFKIPGPDPRATFENEFHVSQCDGTGILPPTRHRDSVSSSGSSLSVPTSPVGLPLSASAQGVHQPSPNAVGVDDDEPWNLVAYQIPWGSAYEGYKAGTLPGPDGPCIFLRSPTPSKKQRTSQACEKCRERKAKCSGGRPACARCEARGYNCIYTPVLIPHSQEVPPRASSSKHPARTLSLSHPERVGLYDTSLASMSRKNSLPESESSTSSGWTRDRSPDVEDGFDSDFQEYYDTTLNGPREASPAPTLSLQPLIQSTAASSAVPPSFSRDVHQHPTMSYVFCGNTHTFPRSAADTLSTDYGAGLDGYRFPSSSSSVVGVRHLTLPHSQSLRDNTPSQLSQPLSETGTVFGNEVWLNRIYEAWGEESLESGLEMDMDNSEPLSAVSTRSLPPFPTSYSEAFAHRDFYSPCGIASENASLEPTFTGLGYEHAYNI